jgi:hypothetical protein
VSAAVFNGLVCQSKPRNARLFEWARFLLQVQKQFHGENDRVKLLVLYCGMEDDAKLVRAASGALATLSCDQVVCQKIITVSSCRVVFVFRFEFCLDDCKYVHLRVQFFFFVFAVCLLNVLLNLSPTISTCVILPARISGHLSCVSRITSNRPL